MPTSPLMIRFTEDDREKIRIIREFCGLTTDASAVRCAIHMMAHSLRSPSPRGRFPKIETKGS